MRHLSQIVYDIFTRGVNHGLGGAESSDWENLEDCMEELESHNYKYEQDGMIVALSFDESVAREVIDGCDCESCV